MTKKPFAVGDKVVTMRFNHWSVDIMKVSEDVVEKVWPSGKFKVVGRNAIYDKNGRYWGRYENGKSVASGHIGARDPVVVHDDLDWAKRWAEQQGRNERYAMFDAIHKKLERLNRKFPPSMDRLVELEKVLDNIINDTNQLQA